MNIAICGTGRAGITLAKYILSSDDNKLIFSICRNKSKDKGIMNPENRTKIWQKISQKNGETENR